MALVIRMNMLIRMGPLAMTMIIILLWFRLFPVIC